MVPCPVKNIAIVSNTSWYVYNFRKSFISKLIDKGFTVFIIAPKDKFVNELVALGTHFVELKKLQSKGRNPFTELMLMLEIRKAFKKNKINVALFFTPKANIFGSIATKFSSTKGIATINGLGFVFNPDQPKWLQFIVRLMYRYAFSNVDAVFFQNKEDRDFFVYASLVGKRQKIYTVRGSGVNLLEFKQRTNFDFSRHMVFLLSARLIKEKGINEYLEAAVILKEKYPKVQFALIGLEADNPSAIPIDKIKQLHLEGIIDYRGSSDNMNETLDNTDVIVLPSFYREGVPRILLEAMSKGLPIITTDNVGCRETVVDGFNGFLIPVNDRLALIEAMEKLINLSPDEFLEMGANSRSKAEKEFDETQNHDLYLEVISKIC